jgi:hypothetical protein
MKLAQYQQDALDLLRARLDPDDPGHAASAEVTQHLREMDVYLDSWVLSLIDVIAGKQDYYGQRDGIAAEARHVRARRKRAAKP